LTKKQQIMQRCSELKIDRNITTTFKLGSRQPCPR
jgi:hypothetical protein